MTITAREATSTLLRGCIGALIAAIVYAASSAFDGVLWMSPELPLWMAVVALTVLPVAVLSSASIRFALRTFLWPPLMLALALAPALAVASVYAFGWYMSEVAPAVNWWRGWWLPAIASLAAAVVEVFIPQHLTETANA